MISILLLTVIIHGAVADLPIHCLRSQVVGRWTWQLTASSTDSHITCGHPSHDSNRDELITADDFEFSPDRRLELSLSYPNHVVDLDTGHTGTFTMVFDEGIEIRISGEIVFAKFKYGLRDGDVKDGYIPPVSDLEAYQSFCSETSIGWYHDESSQNWGCARGHQSQPDEQPQAKPRSSLLITRTTFFDSESQLVRYEPDLDLIRSINSDGSSLWKAGVNQVFIGKSLFNINRMLGRRRYHKPALFQSKKKKRHGEGSDASLPESVDWRYIDSPIRNQGQCGSCYVFSTLSMLETRTRIATPDKDLSHLHFSEQDVLACSRYNEGCQGGYPYLVAKYAHEFGLMQIDTDDYIGYDSICNDNHDIKQRTTTSSLYQYVGGYFGACNEASMMEELALHGPIVAAIQVPASLMVYKSGIFGDCPQPVMNDDGYEQSDHAIVVVGYGEENGTKYWICRNSWGSEYGESGYFRLIRGIDACGIESAGVTSYS